MANLSYAQLAQLALGAGWSRNDAAIAVAVAMGESRGNPMAHNPVPPDNSYGLWQVNMIGSLGSSRRAKYGLVNNEALYNPPTNARVAFAIWKEAGNSFRPWSVYIHGTYRAFLPNAQQAVSSVGSGSGGGGGGSWKPDDGGWVPGVPDPGDVDIPNPIEPIAALVQPIVDLVKFFTNPENWKRVAMFIGGVLLILVAAALLGLDTIASSAIRKVTKALPRKAVT